MNVCESARRGKLAVKHTGNGLGRKNSRFKDEFARFCPAEHRVIGPSAPGHVSINPDCLTDSEWAANGRQAALWAMRPRHTLQTLLCPQGLRLQWCVLR
jgi:hypothetical protein